MTEEGNHNTIWTQAQKLASSSETNRRIKPIIVAKAQLAGPAQADFVKHASSVADDRLPRLYEEGSLVFTCLCISFRQLIFRKKRRDLPKVEKRTQSQSFDCKP